MTNNTFKQTEIGEIPEDWDIALLSEVAKVNEASVNKDFKYEWVEYIDVSSTLKGEILETQKLSLKDAPSRAKRIVSDNDILISTVRPNLKHFAFVSKTKPNLIASTGYAVVSSKKVNPRFLYYYLTTEEYTNYLSAIADTTTSTYPAFNPDVLERSRIPFPSENEQKQIASILSSLDDKIELNRRMNKTLEEIGKALFKQWFVDFEFPNENGEPYKSSGGEMVESELGEIPKGWMVKKVKQIFEINTKSINPSKNGNQNYWHFSIPSFDQYNSPMLELGNTIKSNKTHISQDSILISKLNPKNAKRIWTIFTDRWNEKSISSTEFINVVPKKEDWTWSNFMFRENIFYTYFSSLSTGSTGSRQRVRPTELKILNVLYPDSSVRQLFEKSASHLLLKIDENMHEIMTLTTLRDSLLPRLMSGKIRVN